MADARGREDGREEDEEALMRSRAQVARRKASLYRNRTPHIVYPCVGPDAQRMIIFLKIVYGINKPARAIQRISR